MALHTWYADLRQVESEERYMEIFNALDDLSEGVGLLPACGSGVRVFSVTLDAEDNPDILRDYGRYLSRTLPEK